MSTAKLPIQLLVAMNMSVKHENYEILNLIGYGLAKFNADFLKAFGFPSKSAFYNFIVKCRIAGTVGTVKNRQDLFDPFFDNGRRGWHQKGSAYIHRKNKIDNLLGNLDATDYADVVKTYLRGTFGVVDILPNKPISPFRESQFKKLQATGYSAEIFFMDNYKTIPHFLNGALEDARMLGDGYDFQISVGEEFFLAEVKGIREKSGSFRMTRKEFETANEHKDKYALIVVANLTEEPKMKSFLHPINHFDFREKIIETRQPYYHAKFNLEASL